MTARPEYWTAELERAAQDIAATHTLSLEEASATIAQAAAAAPRELAQMQAWLEDELPGIIATVKARYPAPSEPIS